MESATAQRPKNQGMPNMPPEQQTVPPARSRIAEMRRLKMGSPCANVHGSTPFEFLSFDSKACISASATLPVGSSPMRAFRALSDPSIWPSASSTLLASHWSPDPRFIHLSFLWQMDTLVPVELPLVASIKRLDASNRLLELDYSEGLPLTARFSVRERSEHEQADSGIFYSSEISIELYVIIPDELAAFAGTERVEAAVQEELEFALPRLEHSIRAYGQPISVQSEGSDADNGTASEGGNTQKEGEEDRR